MIMSRRSMFTLMAVASMTPLLTACETITDGTTTTHILKVSKVKAYITAGLNTSSLIVGILSLSPALSKFVEPLNSITSSLRDDFALFNQAVGDTVEISYNDYNWKTIIDSIIINLERLLNIVTSVSSTVTFNTGPSNDLSKKVSVISMALSTIVTIFKTLVDGYISTASDDSSSMSEQDAFKILGV